VENLNHQIPDASALDQFQVPTRWTPISTHPIHELGQHRFQLVLAETTIAKRDERHSPLAKKKEGNEPCLTLGLVTSAWMYANSKRSLHGVRQSKNYLAGGPIVATRGSKLRLSLLTSNVMDPGSTALMLSALKDSRALTGLFFCTYMFLASFISPSFQYQLIN